MTIPSTTTRVSYTTDGVTTTFAVPIQAYFSSDFEITLTPAAGGAATIVTGGTWSQVGSTTPPQWSWQSSGTYAAGQTLQIILRPTQTQQQVYAAGQAFPTSALQANIDRLTSMVLALQDQINRCVRAPDGDLNPATLLAAATLRESMYLATDTNGNVITIAALPGTANTAASLGTVLNPITAAEQAAAVVPTSYAYPAQNVLRYTAGNTTPGTTPLSGAMQQAVDSASASSTVVNFSGEIGFNAPVLLRSTTTEGVGFQGGQRVATILTPTANSIAAAPQNVNCLFFNQNNGLNAHFEGFRFQDITTGGYTGIFLYSVSGGGADGSGKALFSSVIDDCWFSPSSNNNGIFQGGFSNHHVERCVFESTKTGCFILNGAGNSDQQYLGNVMSQCYDAFVCCNGDANFKNIITVDALHAYSHYRGPVIELNNTYDVLLRGIDVQPALAQVAGVGLAQFTACTNVIMTDCTMLSDVANSVPQSTGAAISIINGGSYKFSRIRTDASTCVAFSGAGALDATFEDCDFSNAGAYAVSFVGNLSGKIIFKGCRFNKSQQYALITLSGTHSWDLFLYDCELMDAGMGGATTSNLVTVSTSGAVRLIRCKIGQDTAGAAAANFFNLSGTGAFWIQDPILVGVAPTAFLAAGSTQAISYDGVDSSMPNMPSFTPSAGGSATYSTQWGRWSLKGGVVTFEFRLTIAAIGSGSQTVISGLPFAAQAVDYGVGSVPYFTGSATNVTTLGLTVAPSTSAMTLRSLTAAGAGTANNNILTSGTDLMGHGSYSIY